MYGYFKVGDVSRWSFHVNFGFEISSPRVWTPDHSSFCCDTAALRTLETGLSQSVYVHSLVVLRL